MSSPCTVPRLVRCRVRDLASCFYACRFPLGSNRSQVFDSKRDRSGEKTARKLAVIEPAPRNEDKEESVQSSMPQKSNNNNNNGSKGLGPADLEPSFAEEDYIVFCFREDGAIHMISEGKCSSEEKHSIFHQSNDELAKTCTAISNKIDYGVSSQSEGMIKGDETSDEEVPILDIKKDDGKGSKEMVSEWPPDDGDQPNSSKMDSSFESCDCNVSDTSTSSFAFPVLSIEWMGSPVHMPKTSEKPEARNGRLHCCRF